MCTSSIRISSSSDVMPNSYLVSARISPARSPSDTPRAKIASAASTTRSHSVAVRAGRVPRRRRTTAARRGHRAWALVVGVTMWLGSGVFLRSPSGNSVAVHRPRAGAVHAPQRRVGDTGDVAAHDDLDRQRTGGTGEQRVRVGNGDHVVGDHVGGALEPPRRQLIEHLALVRHAGQHPIERREPVGRDDQASIVAARPRAAHLAVAPVVEREVDRR